MDRRERLDDDVVSLNMALEGLQSTIWTAMPVKVVSVAKLATQNTVNLQPVIMGKYRGPTDQVYSNFKMPILLDCPVHFPSGGPFVLTFPIAVGDEGLVILAARCIDAWFESGANDNVQTEMRMHDLSDGFFLPGFRSRPNAITDVSLTDVELRSLARNAFITIKPNNDITVESASKVSAIAPEVDVVANTSVNVTAPNTNITGDVTITGNLHVTGNITSDATVKGAVVWGTANLQYGTGTPKQVGIHHHTGGTFSGGVTGDNV